MDICCFVLASVLLILGLVGCFISILPGPILSYCGLLCLIPTDRSLSTTALVLLGALTIAVTVADFVIPSIGAKKFNCSSYGTWGCVLGTIVGAFFFPIGIILGIRIVMRNTYTETHNVSTIRELERFSFVVSRGYNGLRYTYVITHKVTPLQGPFSLRLKFIIPSAFRG